MVMSPRLRTIDRIYSGFDGLTALADGAGLEVPQGVTVMIDAGALFKLQEANLDVGSSAEGIDRSAGALQILGTPTEQVSFYSYRNDAIGGDSDGPGPGANPGDWGGHGVPRRFRHGRARHLPELGQQRHDRFRRRQAAGRVGRRDLHSDSPDRCAAHDFPEHDPTKCRCGDFRRSTSSFEDTGNRIGPDIQGNTIIENSLNGLFIRIRTELGEVLDRISLPSRFDDTDITHILTENLLIEATPGGPRKDAATGIIQARLDGSSED